VILGLNKDFPLFPQRNSDTQVLLLLLWRAWTFGVSV